jgi:protein-disulfide isomerase
MVPILIGIAVIGMLAIAGSIDRRSTQSPAASGTAATTVVGTLADAANAGGSATGEAGANSGTAMTASSGGSGPFSPEQRTAIEEIVKSYLLQNPEILIDVQQALEQRMEEQRTASLSKAMKENADDLYKDARTPVAGKGEVTVVEFFDYNCGFCKRAIGDVAKLVESHSNVRVVFKEFPIFGADSEGAARVALAAGMQGKYWEVHKAIFEAEGKHSAATSLKIAEALGLDMEKLKADMNSPEVDAEIKAVRELADRLGVNGTPHFFVGEKVIPGAPEDLYAILEQHVKEVQQNGCAIC